MSLRPLLRARLEPGERVIGWGLALEEPGVARAAVTVALFAVPVLGQALAALSLALLVSQRRVAVLTDRRLMLLHPGRGGKCGSGRGVTLERRLGEFEIKPGRRTAGASAVQRFKLVPSRAPVRMLRVSSHPATASERLVLGLEVVSHGRAPESVC